MKFKSVKSQVTVFLILGIIMVVVFTILILTSGSTVKKALTPEVIGTKRTSLDIQPIKKFVDDCLTVVSKEGLRLLGEQGGTLEKYQDTYEGFLFVKRGETSVFYNIIEQDFSTSKSVPAIPDYPWILFPYEDESSIGTDNKDFEEPSVFGRNVVNPLDHMKGQLESHIKKPYDSVGIISKNNIDRCLNDFSVFEEQGFEISKKELGTSVNGFVKDITVDINENDVVFKMEYPLNIKHLGSGEITEIKDFLVKHEVRLRKLYVFVNELIEKDISDIQFNINAETDFKSLPGFKTGFNIMDVEHDVPIPNEESKDDIIIVTDEKSLLDGVHYQYLFARKNRKPALHLIEANNVNLIRGCSYEAKNSKLECKFEDIHNCLSGGSISHSGFVPSSFKLTKDMFQVEASDSDQDAVTLIYDPLLDRTIFTPTQDHRTLSFRGVRKITVTDNEFEDFQTIDYYIHWDEKCG